MSELPFSPDEILPRLQTVQELHYRYSDDPELVERESLALDALDLGSLVGRHLFVNAAFVFARRPEAPPMTHVMFPSGFLLLGKVARYATITDYDVPIDVVTINLQNADVLEVSLEDATQLKRFEFEVPIPAINSLTYAEAA